jgi:hypothetical protein
MPVGNTLVCNMSECLEFGGLGGLHERLDDGSARFATRFHGTVDARVDPCAHQHVTMLLLMQGLP